MNRSPSVVMPLICMINLSILHFFIQQCDKDPFPQPTTPSPTLPPGQTTTAALPMDTTTAQINPPQTSQAPSQTTTPPSSGGVIAPVCDLNSHE